MLKNGLEAIGKSIRSFGQSLDRTGVLLEGSASYTEHLNPSTRCVNNAGRRPKLEAAAFIAPNASVIGEVNVGSGSSVWYGATLRGDINHITIGNHTNVLDAAIIHVAKIHRDIPTIIGNHVTIGPSSIIHACTIGSNCIIGTGTQILDGSVVESESIVAAGSIVTYGKVISSGQLWSGVPARYVRDLTTEEKAFIKQSAIEYAELSLIHAKECEKSLEEIVAANERSKILEEIGKFGLPEKEKAQQEMGMFFRY